jgi:hypothetical protein
VSKLAWAALVERRTDGARSRRGRRSAAAARALVCLALTTAVGAGAWGEKIAFGPPPDPRAIVGEELEFVIRWGMIPAGRAALAVEAASDKRIVLRASARSLEWLDWLYPVRTTMESTVRLPRLLSLEVLRDSKEGRGRRVVEELRFDRRRRKVRYARDGNAPEALDVPPGARDALAAFYAFRVLHRGSEPARLAVSDGKRVIESSVEILGREEVTTPAGRFSTIKIEPSVAGIGGVFKRSPRARIFIWLTDDQHRRPVRLESKVAIGRVTAELTTQRP